MGQKKMKGKIKADTLLDARSSTYIISPNTHTYEAYHHHPYFIDSGKGGQGG